MRGFLREVALLALPVLSFAGVAFTHLIHANAQTSTWVIALFVAVGTLITAALTRPLHMTVIGGAVISVFTIAAHYWWKMSPAEISEAVIAINLIFGMQVRHQATPVLSPPPPSTQAPAA